MAPGRNAESPLSAWEIQSEGKRPTLSKFAPDDLFNRRADVNARPQPPNGYLRRLLRFLAALGGFADALAFLGLAFLGLPFFAFFFAGFAGPAGLAAFRGAVRGGGGGAAPEIGRASCRERV